MKKALCTLLLMALAAMSSVLPAQTLTVCDGTATSTRVPFIGYQADEGDQHSQFVYPARLLEGMEGGEISSLKFFVGQQPASGTPNFSMQVKLIEVADADTMFNNFLYKSVAGATTVFSGTASVADSVLTISCSQTYAYGGGNLLVDIEVYSATSGYATCPFVGVTTAHYSSVNAIEEDEDYLYVPGMLTTVPSDLSYGDKFHFLPKVEIAYTGTVDCPRPTALAVSAIGESEATLGWTAGGSETQWLVYLDGELVGTSDADTFLFTGLSANMQYTVGVRAFCAEGDTSALNTVGFRTSCGLMSDEVLPWSIDFDTITMGITSVAPFNIPCWVKLDVYSPYASYPGVARNINHTGDQTTGNSLVLTSGAGARPIVALPQFASAANALTLKFYARCNNNMAATDTSLMVGILTDDDQASSFVALDTLNFVAGQANQWQYFEVTFDTALEGRLAFRCRGPQNIYIDDITVEARQACDRPQAVVAGEVGESSVVVSIVDPATLGHYGLRLVAGNDTTETVMQNTLTTVVVDLQPATIYTLEAWGICYDGTQTTSVVTTFRTLSPVFSDLPYYTGFEEDEDTLWTIYGHDGATWVVDTAVAADSLRSLYISADGGQTNSYIASGAKVSYATRSVQMDPGQYTIEFDWRCMGEMSSFGSKWDWLRMVLAPEEVTFADGETQLPFHLDTAQVPDGWISVSNALAGSAEWQHFQTQILIDSAAVYQMVFVWRNDVSGSNGVPAAVDNIVVEQLSCPQVAEVNVDSVGETFAVVSWQAIGSETQWLVSIADTTFSTDSTTVTIDGLQSSTLYEVSVRAMCTATGDTSYAVGTTLLTLQVPVTSLPYQTGFEVGDDAGWYTANSYNGWYIGTAAHDDSSRALYVSNDEGQSNAYTLGNHPSASYAFRTMVLGAGQYELSFDWTGKGELNSDYMRAWLAPENFVFEAGRLPNGNDAFLSSSYWQQTPAGWIDVAGGKLNGENTWQHVVNNFDVDSAGTYNLVFMWANDNTSGQNPAGAVDNILLRAASCPQVDSLTLDSASTTTLHISWTPRGSESQWMVEAYGNITTVSTPHATISGLLHSTAYEVSVRPVCSDSDMGLPESATFRTECGPVSLPYVEDFEQMAGSEEAPCWTLTIPYIGSYGRYPHIYQSSYSAYSGDKYMYSYMYDDAEEMLFASPAIEVGNQGIEVGFHAYFRQESFSDDYGTHAVRLQAGVMSDADDASTFVPVLDTTDAFEDWMPFSFTVQPEQMGVRTFVAFRLTVIDTIGSARTYFGLDSLAVIGFVPQPVDTTTTDTTTTDTTGIAIADMARVTLSPNPATTVVAVSGVDAIDAVWAVSMHGVAVPLKPEDHRIDVSALPSGVYLLCMQTPQGMVVERFIKR